MKKIILIVAYSISLTQAAALRPAGVYTKISPAVYKAFTRATIIGYQQAQDEINCIIPHLIQAQRELKGELTLKPHSSLAKLFNAIHITDYCKALDNYPKARLLSLEIVSRLNANKEIIESYKSSKCPSVAEPHRFVIGWPCYLQTIDEALLRMQKREIPQLNQTNLLQNFALHNHIKELILNNQTTTLSQNEMDHFIATLFGKLGAMEGMRQVDPQAFDFHHKEYI